MSIILAAIAMDGSLGSFVNIPALLFVVLFSSALFLATHGATGLRTLRTLGQPPRDESELNQKIHTVDTLKQSLIVSGWLGMLIGVIQTLSHVEAAENWRAASLLLLTVLYGYSLAYLICFPMSRSLLSQRPGPQTKRPSAHAAR